MGVDAGRLRHRVDIEARQDTQDTTTGGVTTAWAAVFSDVPAAIEPLSVRESIAAGKEASAISTRIMLRFRPGLDATQRIVHGRTCCAANVGVEIYNPQGFLRDIVTGLEYVTIPCSQGANEG